MKKGFTLIEVISVIALLGLIALLFIPETVDILSSNETKVYKTKENILQRAAEDYVISNQSFELPTISSSTKYITASTLISRNYMTKVLDTKSGNECNAFVKITINSTHGYNYEPCLLCDNYTTNKYFCTTSTYNSL